MTESAETAAKAHQTQQAAAAEGSAPFSRCLEALRALTPDKRGHGGAFEKLTAKFLTTAPQYRARFIAVQEWKEWTRGKTNGIRNWPNDRDIGIDLVGIQKDGTLCAIQCKFFTESQITKEMANSFIAASGDKKFAARMFVATGGLSDNLEAALKTQRNMTVLRRDTFENPENGIDYAAFTPENPRLNRAARRQPRPYQEEAIFKTCAKFDAAAKEGKSDIRGRLIMACGTGKTFTSLKIAEKQVGAGKLALFLAPSLALVSQALREWCAQSELAITPFAVCSDSSAGQTKAKAQADELEYTANELDFPATTDASELARQLQAAEETDPQNMRVIFGTYHSMAVIAEAQEKFAAPEIELAICDEAHRTAGQSNSDSEDKAFARILDAGFIRARKRLFMTATPIVYAPASKKIADERDITLYSMDNEALYGPLCHSISFNDAVRLGCLCDYKLIILTVSAEETARELQSFLDAPGKDSRPALAAAAQKALDKLAPLLAESAEGAEILTVMRQTAAALAERSETAAEAPARFGGIFQKLEHFAARFTGKNAELKGDALPKAAETALKDAIKNLRLALEDAVRKAGLDDAAKMAGVYRALSKSGAGLAGEGAPMRSALAFAQVIDASAGKVSSQDFAFDFPIVADNLRRQALENGAPAAGLPEVACRHVDGSMPGNERDDALRWLRESAAAEGETPSGAKRECRVLSNVRCLSEGVDVPALDAVIFLAGKNSQIEITQAVGRVMRVAKGKKLGYVILPVVIPPGADEAAFLNESTTWKATYGVVQALRSHDAGIDNSIARAAKGEMSGKIEIIDSRVLKPSSEAESSGLPRGGKTEPAKPRKPRGAGKTTIGAPEPIAEPPAQLNLSQELIRQTIFAKLAASCGTRLYWQEWAKKFADTANNLMTRMKTALANDSAEYAAARKAFAKLQTALQENISSAIDAEQTLKILAAQGIAQPVFSALFGAKEHDFPANNAVAKSLQTALDEMLNFMAQERKTLNALYAEIESSIGANPSDAFRQSLIKDIYQNTIHAVYGADKAASTVVYTPIPAVDFILRSVAAALKAEFNASFDDDNITVLEPFAGTGSFITRLLSGRALPEPASPGLRSFRAPSPAPQLSGNAVRRGTRISGQLQTLGRRFISPAALPEFYQNRLWLNEINLLAYYAAIANIETTFHRETGQWQSFKNACLTDTFILNRAAPSLLDNFLAANRETLKRQEKAAINIIIGNPPYGAALSRDYPDLDTRIKATYAAAANRANLNSLYDGYIRAFRWATDRIKGKGIIAFITGGGFLTSSAASGLRKHLAADFSTLYIFNLRGDIRSELGNKGKKTEGGNIFNVQVGIAISILIKNPDAAAQGQIFYHDIGDCLPRGEERDPQPATKLGILAAGDIYTLPFTRLTPDKHGDWLNHRDDSFQNFLPVESKSDKSLFIAGSNGIKTNRDAWAVNYSKTTLADNMARMIAFYNTCAADKRIVKDEKSISWTRGLESACRAGKTAANSDAAGLDGYGFDATNIVPCLYRPFTRSRLYYSRRFNEMVYQMPQIFPNVGGECAENLVIQINQNWSDNGSLAIITDIISEIHLNGDTQAFPLYIYEDVTALGEQGAAERLLKTSPAYSDSPESGVLITGAGRQLLRKSAVSPKALALFRKHYAPTGFAAAEMIAAEDIFYYIYALLHAPAYREKYKNNLMKELPRIPRVKTYAEFTAFAAAGRRLAELHLNFDDFGGKTAQELAAAAAVELELPPQITAETFRVEKMKFASGKGAWDKSEIRYNPFITLRNIPLKAYDYIINGKSAIEWVIDRWQMNPGKKNEAGIINDPNAFAAETGDPAYPLKLLLSVISLSLETQTIISACPKLNFEELK